MAAFSNTLDTAYKLTILKIPDKIVDSKQPYQKTTIRRCSKDFVRFPFLIARLLNTEVLNTI